MRLAEHQRLVVQLVGASFLALFQELALIRWLPGQVRALAYFPNLVLLGAFLGLGLGAMLSRRRPVVWLWPASLTVLALAAWGASRVAFSQNNPSEHLWLLYFDLHDPPVFEDLRLPIIVAFALVATSFVTLGQVIGGRLQSFRALERPLAGYTLDLAGSLAGVVVFAAVSFGGLLPWTWFGALMVLGSLILAGSRVWERMVFVALGVAVVGLVAVAERASYYSPYYALSLARARDQLPVLAVLANGSVHQFVVNMVPSGADDPRLAAVRAGYRIPYERLPRPPRRVLVLGAGTGNDVAVALAAGAEHVDAVEIDATIGELGKAIHPNNPYASPRVTLHIADARTYLNSCQERYDLIVFATLDSMTRLSALSHVRLDNFVYTKECLARARLVLSERGGLAMYFMVGHDFIDRRLTALMEETFGQPPAVVAGTHHLFNHVYLAGPAYASLLGPARAGEQTGRAARGEDVPTDDWPFLYLDARRVSGFYVTIIVLIAGLAVGGVALVGRVEGTRMGRPDVQMFFFGLAFLLLETKSVTEINLLWGATWITSAVVFAAILLMILLATQLANHCRIPFSVAAGGLLVSLLVTYAVPVHRFLFQGWGWRAAASLVFVGVPIGFAGVCFGLAFKTRADTGQAFAWNLVGAVAGGLLEFLVMVVGLKALTLVALASYLVVVLSHGRSARLGQAHADLVNAAG